MYPLCLQDCGVPFPGTDLPNLFNDQEKIKKTIRSGAYSRGFNIFIIIPARVATPSIPRKVFPVAGGTIIPSSVKNYHAIW